MQQNYSTHAINSPYKLINVCANAPTQSSLNPEHCHHIIQNRVCYIALHSSLTDRESHFPSSTQFTYISYIYIRIQNFKMFQNVLTLVSLRKPAASTHLAHGLETPSTIPLVAKAAKAHKQTHASFSRAASSSRFASISA